MHNAFHKTNIEREIATNQVQALPVWRFSLADPVSHCLGPPDPNVDILRSAYATNNHSPGDRSRHGAMFLGN